LSPRGALGTTYSVYLRLIGSFLVVFIELFSLGVTAEVLKAMSIKNQCFSADSLSDSTMPTAIASIMSKETQLVECKLNVLIVLMVNVLAEAKVSA